MTHLFIHCRFAKLIWNQIGVTIKDMDSHYITLEKIKQQLIMVPFFHGDHYSLMLGIWISGNGLIFMAKTPL